MDSRSRCQKKLERQALIREIFRSMLAELGAGIKTEEVKTDKTGLYKKKEGSQRPSKRPLTAPDGSAKTARQVIAAKRGNQTAGSPGVSGVQKDKASGSGLYKKKEGSQRPSRRPATAPDGTAKTARQVIAAKRSGQASAGGQNVSIDPFVGSPDVLGLQGDNFNDFLREKDAAMVMFYVTSVPACGPMKDAIEEAAKITERENHAYAAVDCTVEPTLCLDEKVQTVPSFKLYSLGRLLADFDNNMAASELKKLVETAPLAQIPKPSTSTT